MEEHEGWSISSTRSLAHEDPLTGDLCQRASLLPGRRARIELSHVAARAGRRAS
jgi:hypothetical protein